MIKVVIASTWTLYEESKLFLFSSDKLQEYDIWDVGTFHDESKQIFI